MEDVALHNRGEAYRKATDTFDWGFKEAPSPPVHSQFRMIRCTWASDDRAAATLR